MGAETTKPGRYQFGVFELAADEGELRKHGVRIKLQEQPFRILALLVEHPGEVVTREELRQNIWGQDIYVDFDHSLNISVNKLREALGDSASNPRFIETVPKRGYRFLAPVRPIAANVGVSPVLPGTDPLSPAPGTQAVAVKNSRSWYWLAWGTAAVAILVIMGLWFHQKRETASSPRRVMLAVLPFENLSPEQQEGMFVTGLHDELIAQLGRLHPTQLGVIARTSVLQYAHSPKPIDQVGKELNVDYVLEGTVRRVGDHFRVVADLVKVSDQTQLWAETYEPTMGDMLAMQEDVASRVSQAVSVEFLPAARKQIEAATTSDAAAYEAYLKGRFFWYQETRPSLETAITYFQNAIALDPRYASAYSGLADAYGVMGGYGFVPAAQVFPKSKDAAMKALELDPNSSSAYNSLAFISFYYDWDWPNAEQLFRKATELNPNNQDAHEFLASYLHAMGRLDEAEAENKIALQVDPLNAWLYDDKGWMLLSRRRPDEAIANFRRAIQLNPNFPAAHLSLAVAYGRTGKFQEALAEVQKAEALGGDPTRVLEVRGATLALSGDRQSAEAVLDQLIKGRISGRVSPYSVALIYTTLGRKAEAIDWLERCYREKDTWVVWTGVLVEWDSLRNEPRFIDLQRKLRMPQRN
jgi:TolB-like protein/DNA-binding winged helix-turn-helix (wHTH) protein/tetratricopeptide (TPR) repeat protein